MASDADSLLRLTPGGLQVYALRQAYAETRDSSEGLGSEVSRLQREVENLRSQLQRASSTSLKQVRTSASAGVKIRDLKGLEYSGSDHLMTCTTCGQEVMRKIKRRVEREQLQN